MGLPGQNVKVLLDGVPLVGRQGTGNEININQINVNSIERIEVVEGPMSVIYGADALAGVINIITKKSLDDRLSLSASVHEESAGKEYGLSEGIHNQSVSFGYRVKSFYFNGNVTRNGFGGWQGDSTGREKEWHPKTQWLGAGVVGYNKGGFNAYFRFDGLNEKIYNPGQFQGREAIDQNYITNRFMQQVQLTNSFSDRLSGNAAFSYTNYERRTQSIAVDRETKRETLTSGELQNSDKFSGLTLRGAVNYKLSEVLSLQPGFDISTETGSGPRIRQGNNSISDYAGFLSADIKTRIISFKPGVRFVKNSVYDAPPVIPSLNTKVVLGESDDLKFSYGRGFRAPSIRELYFNFFDASHSIEGNPNLEAELSHSFNGAWNSRLITNEAWTLKTTVSGFYNHVENMIDYGIKSGGIVTTYINVNRFKSTGFSASGTLKKDALEFRAGFAYTGRYNSLVESSDVPEFSWSPEINSSVTYRFTPSLTVFAFYKYTGKTPAYFIDPSDNKVVLSETAGYHWADITIQKSFPKYLSLSCGVRNLLNVTRIANSTANGAGHGLSDTTRPVGYGRSFFVALNFRFTKS